MIMSQAVEQAIEDVAELRQAMPRRCVERSKLGVHVWTSGGRPPALYTCTPVHLSVSPALVHVLAYACPRWFLVFPPFSFMGPLALPFLV